MEWSGVWAHLAAELLQNLTLIKMGVAVLVVILLSTVAELVSPRAAGILSGYPFGAAINLFFIGHEINLEFAARSALFTLLGLVGTIVFGYTYYTASLATRALPKGVSMATAALGGLLAYFLTIALLRRIEWGVCQALALPVGAIVLFHYLLRHIDDVRIENRAALYPKALLFRCLFAATMIVVITSTARLVGPEWAGLFSAFPVTMLPFLLIIHFVYDSKPVHTILKNVPRGIGALVVYAQAVNLLYPSCGLAGGTALAYLLATAYLFLLQSPAALPRWRRASRPLE